MRAVDIEKEESRRSELIGREGEACRRRVAHVESQLQAALHAEKDEKAKTKGVLIVVFISFCFCFCICFLYLFFFCVFFVFVFVFSFCLV